ncbi:rhodanese-like domain-containing protein [Lysinibacillus antri]|uniref:Rhodanese-like domain-containing protein n=1 Tax=Lysinibacillus antri TaxID=2498145 RepID=A0A3S0RVH7_9BACI|nr:rhodanese-like domain-containing protein [Lysinibacillus antri]RUL52040.1 rhodanese-like domain-containing protein [Lysinibacillus antri]
MEWILIILLIALFIYRLMPAKGIKTITAKELKPMLNDPNKVFVDVRTPSEFKGQSIRQFINMPLRSDFSKLPKDKEIVVICQTGIRSNQACKKLKRLGFRNITNVRGGIGTWEG